jgi:putative endonuclease
VNNQGEKAATVYIMANERRDAIYVGVTSRLWPRVAEHKAGSAPGFTGRYALTALVWYEYYDSMEQALLRERWLKVMDRKWKSLLIEKTNPEWVDLHSGND